MSENKHVVFTGRGIVELGSEPMPSIGDHEYLVKTEISMISTGTELSVLLKNGITDDEKSIWNDWGVYPFTPGYNNIGTVVKAGKDANQEWVGKRVANGGQHKQYVVLEEKHLSPIRDDISMEEAVFFTIAQIVMQGVRRSGVKFGESVVIYGAGLLGQFAAQLFLNCGAKPVCVVDVSDDRLKLVPDSKSLIKINPTKQDVKEEVSKATKGRMADIVVELTGSAKLIPSEFDVIRKQGKFIMLSSPIGKTLFDFHDLCNGPSITIIGAHTLSHPEVATFEDPFTVARDIELYFDMVADGDLDVKRLISHKEHYTEAVKLYHMLVEDRTTAMGVILDWRE